MASILRVNTLTDASSNNSIATSFVAGGSAKAWFIFDQVNSNTLDDSFNIGSITCLLYTSPSPRDATLYRMPSSA